MTIGTVFTIQASANFGAWIPAPLGANVSLHTFLQILSVTVFEKIELAQVVTNPTINENQDMFDNQLNLFKS